MPPSTDIFQRPALAQAMAQRLLHPGVLDEGLRSGLFISGLRRQGKTTFLLNDLIPELEQQGAIVIYVDLWSNTKVSPESLVLDKIRATLGELQNPASRLMARLKSVAGLDVGILLFKFGFKLDTLGKEGGPTLAEVLQQVVDQGQRDVVLIVDEVQHAITTEDGRRMLEGLKAARDAINPRPKTPGHFIMIGTGSHRAMVAELTTRRSHAFEGATSLAYPVLSEDYVAHLLARIRQENAQAPLPSLAVANQAFATVGHRPEELRKALRAMYLAIKDAAQAPDVVLPIVARTLRLEAAEIEFRKIEDMGVLAAVLFDRIACGVDEGKGLFSSDALNSYQQALGREVATDEVQRVVNDLLSENLVMRSGRGRYVVTDPFVCEAWVERQQIDREGVTGGG
jgi:hypothetical protein